MSHENARILEVCMPFSILDAIDLVGTIAFVISGAFVGISKKMDLFGVNMLAIAASCCGGLIRDLIIGNVPPMMFQNPFYVCVAFLSANAVFALLLLHQHMPRKMVPVYERTLFLFDTLGLASFTVDGVMVGVHAGYPGNIFLLVVLGFMTGVGGGVLRDVLAGQIPDIFRKHIYALASISGALTTALLLRRTSNEFIAMLSGFSLIFAVRLLAAHFRWNLPKISDWESGDHSSQRS